MVVLQDIVPYGAAAQKVKVPQKTVFNYLSYVLLSTLLHSRRAELCPHTRWRLRKNILYIHELNLLKNLSNRGFLAQLV